MLYKITYQILYLEKDEKNFPQKEVFVLANNLNEANDMIENKFLNSQPARQILFIEFIHNFLNK